MCSPDGRPFEVSNDELCDFAIQNGLIDSRAHFSSVKVLIDQSSGKKQLQMWQPVSKLKWLMLIDKTSGDLVTGRAPVPVLGTPQFFVSRVVPMIPDMCSAINDHKRLGQYLRGTYYPNGKSKPPATHYVGWKSVKFKVPTAVQLLQLRHEVRRRKPASLPRGVG